MNDTTVTNTAVVVLVPHTVAGVSCACADQFGASTSAHTTGMNLIKDNPIPRTTGVAGPRTLVDNGFSILTF